MDSNNINYNEEVLKGGLIIAGVLNKKQLINILNQ